MNCNIENCENCSITLSVRTGPLPNELHLTVNEADVELFRETCAKLGVKAVLLDLQLSTGGVMKDLMTSSTFFGNQTEVLNELKRVSEGLTAAGFSVVREKIESAPWHTEAPTLVNQKTMPDGCYFESHVAIQMREDQRATVDKLARTYDAHLSKNVFKKDVNDESIVMLTLRSYSQPFEEFSGDVLDLAEVLKNSNFKVAKVIHEFCWYDSKIDHDDKWTGLKYDTSHSISNTNS